MTKEILSQRITRLRTAQHLSRRELAAKLRLSHVAIGKWENGDTENIKLANLVGLAQVLNTTVGDLLGEKPEKAEPPRITETDSLPDHSVLREAVAGVVGAFGLRLTKFDDKKLTFSCDIAEATTQARRGKLSAVASTPNKPEKLPGTPQLRQPRAKSYKKANS